MLLFKYSLASKLYLNYNNYFRGDVMNLKQLSEKYEEYVIQMRREFH